MTLPQNHRLQASQPRHDQRIAPLLQTVVHEHAVVPAHSPHAPLQPPPHALDKHATHVECWTQSRLPPASERCNDSRLVTVAKFQPASESSQKTGRLDKGSFLGRRPMLKRTHISHQHLKDATTLVKPGLQSSNQRQSLPQKTGRLDKNAFLGRQPVLNRTHTSRQRLEDATEPLLASMRPACTIDNAGPVRWMSEVSLPTSVAYEPFPPASEGCQDSRRTRVAKLQSASESSTEDRAT